jgi:hypothetical protein
MGEFLRGWRRKVGCVTLLLACAVVGMWVRSYFGGMDHVVQPIVGSIITLHKSPSTSHPVIWVSTPLQDPDRKHWMKGNLGYHSDQWLRREWGGFVFSHHVKQPRLQLVFPYWSIILPLTLLSAYLILVPSWKRPTTTSQPHA